MSRRRKSTKRIPVQPFAGAPFQINRLEAAVAYRTVTADFTLLDVVHWLWPSDTVQKLKDAYPLADTHHGYVFRERVFYAPFCFGIQVNVEPLGMLIPKTGTTKLNPNARNSGEIASVVHGLHELHERFNRLRRVVDFFNEHLTVGAAKFYFPHLGSLLPAEHPFHRVDGQVYREPSVSMAPIMDDIRVSVGTLASALLCEPGSEASENPHGAVGFQIFSSDTAYSQTFYVL